MRITIKVIRKAFAAAVGVAQSTMGMLAVIAAYILHSDPFGLRAWLYVNTGFPVPLYVLVLIVFGFFSITSGLILITEDEESP